MDKVTICNMALNYLGIRSIASLEENTPSAKAMSLYFDAARDTVLADHPWNFAIARKRLNLIPANELWHPIYSFAHTYPNDAIKVWGLQTPVGNVVEDFEVGVHEERQAIYSNVFIPIAVYTVRQLDTNTYSPGFVQALSRKLQAMVAMPLIKSANVETQAEEMYRLELSRAQQADATEGRRFNAPSRGWRGGHATPTGDWVDNLQRNYWGI